MCDQSKWLIIFGRCLRLCGLICDAVAGKVEGRVLSCLKLFFFSNDAFSLFSMIGLVWAHGGNG